MIPEREEVVRELRENLPSYGRCRRWAITLHSSRTNRPGNAFTTFQQTITDYMASEYNRNETTSVRLFLIGEVFLWREEERGGGEDV